MLLMKRIFLGIAALVLIFLGGNGTQSSNTLMQGSGAVGLVIGLIVLYVFAKLIWKAMGCLPSLVLLGGIVFFLFYAIGAFEGGVNNIVPNLKNFFGVNRASMSGSATEGNALQVENDNGDIVINESFDDIAPISETSADTPLITETPQTNNAPESPAAKAMVQPELIKEPTTVKQPEQQKENGGFMGFMNNLMGGGNNDNTSVKAPKDFNPNDYPAVTGSVKVVDGDTLIMRGHYIRLYGIDAPHINQSCANSQGRSYACGKEASRWLEGWIQDNELECHVLKQDSKGNVVGTCALGQYDLGAALVTAGWAVTLPENAIYKPYEEQAQRARRGMWQGQFYKPWDWVKIQSKKPKIKVIKQNNKKMLWDYL